MKIPELSKVESVLLIVAVGAGLYVAYRAYSAGSTIKDAISTNLGKAADSVTSLWDSAVVAANKARTSVVGADVPSADDQSDAESARLARQNSQAQYNGMPSIYDDQYNIKPEYDPTQPTVMGLNNETSQPAMAFSPEPFTFA